DDRRFLHKLLMMQRGNYETSILKYVKRAAKKYEDILNESEDMKTNHLEGIVLVHYTLGSNYKRQGSFKKAEEHFKKIIDLSYGMLLIVSNKYRGGAHFHLGGIYQECGDKERSRHHFEECLRFIPHHRKARETLLTKGKIYRRSRPEKD
ncbi:hypothetical protein KJ640_01920, partial [bacterium]|nr:hypothetical protein [bacterium]